MGHSMKEYLERRTDDELLGIGYNSIHQIEHYTEILQMAIRILKKRNCSETLPLTQKEIDLLYQNWKAIAGE